ncbi:hypothetical protein Btru_017607 [Bulinus truncatus]|nr:hypothetical protein Btru_017607 [Bulinus truncatus]
MKEFEYTIIQAVSTGFGQKFLVSYTRMTQHYLAWPHITPELFFLVISRHMRNQISITTVWYNTTDQHVPLDMKVELNRTVPALFVTIPKMYHYRINIGLQHSFCLLASQDFALVVVLFDHIYSTAAYRALPVDGWGRRYYAVTLGYYISLVTVANEGPNTISYTIKAEHPDTFLLTHDRSYSHGTQWEVTLLANKWYPSIQDNEAETHRSVRKPLQDKSADNKKVDQSK